MTTYIDYYKGICTLSLVGVFKPDIALLELERIIYMKVILIDLSECYMYSKADLNWLVNKFEKKTIYIKSKYKYIKSDFIYVNSIFNLLNNNI